MRMPERLADGTVRGWRTWSVRRFKSGRVYLVSFIGLPREAWPRGVIDARCLLECDTLMDPECMCGVYAFHDLATFWQHRVEMPPRDPFRVVGEVCGWGRVNVHEHGWRAEFAMVRALWTQDVPPEEAQLLGQYYDVPVGSIADLPGGTEDRWS